MQRWAAHRDGLLTPKRSEPYLFPAISDDGKYPHLTSSYLARAMRQWVRLLDRVDSEGTGRDGLPVPLDKDKIFPYAFRHSYAQRHADANVPIDVLKELMDHKSTDTTARYYKVSLGVPSRRTSRRAGMPARSDSSAPAAASTVPTRRTWPRSRTRSGT
ncbi:tyrosine-type recombinase/integrase [Streptomyces acidiscabies]|uniref:tyrosine-type recombinase/integrase n=1 Tax=Streptomyces acidiscabies TaxID=42234 RepID=UPI002D218A31|nr:tyrosine-type recombinase/integrase [Streptomyces acidiscabies]